MHDETQSSQMSIKRLIYVICCEVKLIKWEGRENSRKASRHVATQLCLMSDQTDKFSVTTPNMTFPLVLLN